MIIRSRSTVAALVLAIAGLALPAAPAATRQAGRANDTSDVISRYLRSRANDTSDVVSRYQRNRAYDTSDVVSRYVSNRTTDRSDASAPTSGPSALAAQVATSHGFDWNDALIGAGIALAIVLLLSATGIGVVRHRHSHLTSA